MRTRVSRRDALKHIGVAGAAAALTPRLLFQTGPITVNGRPVEVSVISIGPSTVRLLITPLVDGNPTPLPDDGVLEPGRLPASQAAPFRTAVPGIDALH